MSNTSIDRALHNQMRALQGAQANTQNVLTAAQQKNLATAEFDGQARRLLQLDTTRRDFAVEAGNRARSELESIQF